MTSPSITSHILEKGVDVDGVEWEEGATESDYLDRNYASLRFTVTASMAHMKVKWLDKEKGTEKWCKILVIAVGKMSLSWDAKSK